MTITTVICVYGLYRLLKGETGNIITGAIIQREGAELSKDTVKIVASTNIVAQDIINNNMS